jgi:hypothetical protein
VLIKVLGSGITVTVDGRLVNVTTTTVGLPGTVTYGTDEGNELIGTKTGLVHTEGTETVGSVTTKVLGSGINGTVDGKLESVTTTNEELEGIGMNVTELGTELTGAITGEVQNVGTTTVGKVDGGIIGMVYDVGT